PDGMALDGSEVRLLCELPRGAMAMFTLPPDAISKAVAHRTIEELWCVIRGRGRIWRKIGDREDVTDLVAGVSVAIPTGAHFQFRNDARSRSTSSPRRCRPGPAMGKPIWSTGNGSRRCDLCRYTGTGVGVVRPSTVRYARAQDEGL